MRGLNRSLWTFGSLVLIYLVPPVVVQIIHWAVTGNSRPFPSQFLYVLFGVFFINNLLRRHFSRPEDFPL